jgi:peptidoglycan biosynthesis protein MviN/MurJ (putative lipid II flippase)
MARKIVGYFALALGTVCGIIIETALLGIALSRQGISVAEMVGNDPHLRKVSGQYLPMITGLSLRQHHPHQSGMAASLGWQCASN